MLGAKEVLRKTLLVSNCCDKRGTAGKRDDVCGRELVRSGKEEVTEEKAEKAGRRGCRKPIRMLSEQLLDAGKTLAKG